MTENEIKVLIEKERAEARCEALCEVAKRIVMRFETAQVFDVRHEMSELCHWVLEEVAKIRDEESK